MGWYNPAIKTIKGNSAGDYTSGPFKGVLHTTEGTSSSGAISAFKTNNSWPHFLIDNAGKVWQFLDTSVAARTLRNLSGGVETNRDSAIQIEIVGFANKPNEHPANQLTALKALMRWIENETGVKSKGPGRPFASAYGQNNLRFKNAEWDGFDGWCGHCHVPENDHWDPGTINLTALLAPTTVEPQYMPNITAVIAASVKLADGRVYLTGPEGNFYGFEIANINGPYGQPYFAGRKVARLWRNDAPEVPDYAAGLADGFGIAVQTVSNEWYGDYR